MISDTNPNLPHTDLIVPPSPVTKGQESELRRLKAYFPCRICFGWIDKDTKAWAVDTAYNLRRPNALARAGHAVFILH